MSSPFQKQFSAKSPLSQVDPDAPGTPGKPGYEPSVKREELDDKGKEIYDNLRKERDNERSAPWQKVALSLGWSEDKINAMRLKRHLAKKKEQK